MAKKKRKIKVAVGMSGGVDSSVAAALLKDQGYAVIGVFMKFWAERIKGKARENICCSLESAEDARRVCRKFKIPFYVINMTLPFKKKIVDNFIAEYDRGRTPNPCVRCNKYIKFSEFFKKMKPLGVDFVATGHYALTRKAQGSKGKRICKLFAGKDKGKDQSYFLHQLTQADLARTLFPLGKYTKDKVRKLAVEYGLPTASKKESQEICFVARHKVGEFLKKHIKFVGGDILEFNSKKKLGEHDGLLRYTIGQRKGIGLSGGPWYVVGADSRANALYVSKNKEDLLSSGLTATEVNWICGAELKFPLKAACRIRYRSASVPCRVEKSAGDKYSVTFSASQRAVTPGQYCVFYRGEECLGGGVIE